MRKEAFDIINEMMFENENIVFLTADLGYWLLDGIKESHPERFHNVGSSEQLLLGAAVGLALSGKIPICYSITPFLLCRPFELIRNYVNREGLNVKLIGAGRDRDYGHDGFSHWAEDHVDIMSLFPNITTFVPKRKDELEEIRDLILSDKPVYINLRK